MPRHVIAVAVTLAVCVPSGRASEGSPRTVHYITAGSRLDYAVVKAPLPARRLGAIGLASLAALRDPAAPVPSILGEASAPPPGWPAALDSGEAGRAPFAAADARGPCRCATVLGDTGQERVAALYASRAFTVGDEIATLRTLRLRVRYQDGLIVYINGREVVRRNIAAGAAPLDIAERPHGPEWETFYIPVVPGLVKRGPNRLSIEVRPSGRRLAPRLDIELSAAKEARIVRGPMIQRVTRTSAVVVFETDLPVAGVVEYGPTAERGHSARSAGGGLAMRHVVELRDLPPGQAVHYRVRAGSAASRDLVFHTAPLGGEVIRFVVYGDVRGGHDTHADLVAAIAAEAPDFVLVTGDLVLRGSDEADWQRFFAITGDLIARVPYYPAAGNHDVGRSGDQRRRMNEIFALWPGPDSRPPWGHWYSFDVADVHIIVLDSNAYEREEQLTWLAQDLADARARGVRALFAVVHDGPYSRGLHRGNGYAAEHYAPLLARHGVTLTFSGHDHLYQRGEVDGFAYMVSGGGGAPLYSVRCGVPGKRRCRVDDGMQHVAKEHHYVLVTVYGTHVEACPKRADGTPLEPCLTYPLAGRAP